MVEVRFTEKPSFSVVGKEGSGTAAGKWMQELWDVANASFGDIIGLALRDRLGKPQVWGIMTGVDRNFKPWDARGGLYLAGCEVADDTAAPEGWTKWTVPGYRYAVAEYTEGTYGDVFAEVLREFFPANGLKLAGAVHEFYPPSGALELWFPIEKL